MSTFSPEEIQKLEEVLDASGLEHRTKGGSYTFADGTQCRTVKTLYERLDLPEVISDMPGMQDLALKFYKGQFPDKEFKKLVDGFCANLQGTEIPQTEYKISVQMKEKISGLSPLVDASRNSKDRLILVDPQNGDRPVPDVSTEIYLANTGLKMGEILSSPDIPAVYPTYNPYRHEAIFEDYNKYGEVVPFVNYYSPPRWHGVEVPPAYRGKIRTLIEHVFPNEEEREQVLDWMHYAITKKNGTVLCLAGARGIGKTLLMENVMSALLGESNVELVNSEILTEKFNSAFKNRRLLVFEEVEITTDKALNKFKAFCNNKIVVEEKGQDSHTITSYVSMVVMLNNMAQLKIMPQERRFSIPEVTGKKLEDVMSTKEISELVQEVANPVSEELAEFGHWLLQRKPERTELDPIKGRYYFRVSATNLSAWKAFVIEYLFKMREKKSVTSKDLKAAFRKAKKDESAIFPSKPTLIEAFFMDYRYEGVCQVGDVTYHQGGDFSVSPTKEFLEETQERFDNGESAIDYKALQEEFGSAPEDEEEGASEEESQL